MEEDNIRKFLEQEEAHTKEICDKIPIKYLNLLQKEVVKEKENEAKRVMESNTEEIMGKEEKVMELPEVIKDSTGLRGVILNKDVTNYKVKRRIAEVVQKADYISIEEYASPTSPSPMTATSSTRRVRARPTSRSWRRTTSGSSTSRRRSTPRRSATRPIASTLSCCRRPANSPRRWPRRQRTTSGRSLSRRRSRKRRRMRS